MSAMRSALLVLTGVLSVCRENLGGGTHGSADPGAALPRSHPASAPSRAPRPRQVISAFCAFVQNTQRCVSGLLRAFGGFLDLKRVV